MIQKTFSRLRHSQSGLSLIEVLIVAAVSTLVFGALLSSYRYSLELLTLSRAKLSALSLANDRMEYFRSLPYDDVGTVSGIPTGTIPQNSTSTLNGITFNERILVEYVDDDADGTGGSDTNAIPSDYKRIKAEYTWSQHGNFYEVTLVSNVVPRSVETTSGGGTVRVNVIDDQSLPLPGADVRLINNTTTSTIDVVRSTDSSGAALFSGAPAASDYEVIVSALLGGDQYSTAQTHQATTSNPNPTVAPFALLEADVSTITFQIGALSDMSVELLTSRTDSSIVNTTFNIGLIASSTDISTSTGQLLLADTAGVYQSSGVAYFGPYAPASIEAWQAVQNDVSLPSGTSVRWQLFTESGGVFTLVPDADLPNNSVGFTALVELIDSVDTITYPSIYLGFTLSTTDTTVTPQVSEVGVYYRESSSPAASTAFSLRGVKQIGAQLDATPIYKYDQSHTTDINGEVLLTDMEFDQYSVSGLGGYDIASACSAHPFQLAAGVDATLELLLVGDTAHTLRVSVVDALGTPVPAASVNLNRSGYDVTIDTDGCGQAFFSGLAEETDFVLTISRPGYTTDIINPLSVSGDVVTDVTLN